MRLSAIILRNFRPYSGTYRIPIDSFAAFVGRNDIGKSCVLEALNIFFNESTIDIDDLSKPTGDDPTITIGCAFTELPSEIILDAHSRTTLAEEHLLNEEGALEIHKVWDCTGGKLRKAQVFANAHHPSAENYDDLLLLKREQLRSRLRDLEIAEAGIDMRSNPPMRQAIWAHAADLQRRATTIPLDDADAKTIWGQIEERLPMYALFRADRPSTDEDAEVQDPMKIAIKEALAPLVAELDAIKEAVRTNATAVAARTLDKLRDFDQTLANQLAPSFRADPKWDTLFKLMLTGENDIPINKRGSGVRRLILLSFFRAEAERQAGEGHVIYAVEEPETSQHPHNQRLIVKTLLQLSEQGRQVLITTHNPSLASLVPIADVRYVHIDAGRLCVESNTDTVWNAVAAELGVLPDSRVQALVCLEGPHDVSCLGQFSRLLHGADDTIPDVLDDPRIAVVTLGGSTLKQWVERDALRYLNRPEFHWYDRDEDEPPRYQAQIDQVNARDNGSYGTLTGKREIENYLHTDAITEEFGHAIVVTDVLDVPDTIAGLVHEAAPDHVGDWTGLDEDKKGLKIRSAKKRLNNGAAARMTAERLAQSDPNGHISDFLLRVGAALH